MKNALNIYEKELEGIREAGTYKDERFITTPQSARIDTTKANNVDRKSTRLNSSHDN